MHETSYVRLGLSGRRQLVSCETVAAPWRYNRAKEDQ
jgi:hypothetical protein